MQDIHEIITELQKDAPEEFQGISLPGPEHQPLVEGVNEVSERLKVKPPRILIHKGSAMEPAAYLGGLDILLLNEKIPGILEPNEFKAQVTHEMDHRGKAENTAKMRRWINKLIADGNQPEAKRVIEQSVPRFLKFTELAADDLAIKMYGAETVSRAIQKTLVAAAEESPKARAVLFPDVRPEEIDRIGPDQIRKRVSDIAEGTYRLPGPEGELLNIRFERCRSGVAAQR